MAWEEWEQAKTEVADRRGTRMRLNQVDPGGGGDTGTLVSNKPAWSRAGHDVGALGDDMGKALGKLSDGQEGLAADAGCRTAAAQKDVHGSWQRYLKGVRGRCAKLAGLLDGAGSDQLKTDEALKAELGNLKVEYADTPAVGGQSKGR
ncbi:hypothetical protein [Streptomyces sp. NPDC014734]|uniref:hypothetical protein n=1 Tax=Streptomyces sp. NPDC014734 TaxID=3364886 RepID=UPI003700A5BD